MRCFKKFYKVEIYNFSKGCCTPAAPELDVRCKNDDVDIGKKRAEQLAHAFGVHPAIIMFPEYEAELIQKVA